MKQAYLFVHFREKRTPDGEQVYFGISRDGFHWESLNGGKPILWCYYGDKGARDFTVTFCRETGKYVILATDLSLAYGMRGKYHNSWQEVSRKGSKCLALWESEDLLHWSEQRLVQIGDEKFGCLWAPDVIYDREAKEYVVHWSSSHEENGYGKKAIYCCRTKDFEQFSAPELLYRHPEEEVIDSAIYEEKGAYYMFVRRGGAVCRNILLRSENLKGPYEQMPAFDESTAQLQQGVYEAPTAVKLEDGRWCLFLDYFGVPGAGQGYVPFVADSLESGDFVRADEKFMFPYGYKHGTILTITPSQYEALAGWNWE